MQGIDVDLHVGSECYNSIDAGGLAAGVKATKELGEGRQSCHPDPPVLSNPWCYG